MVSPGVTYTQDKPFVGQCVLITGGGTGIGRAAALAFASQGAANLIITGRRAEPLAQVAALDPTIVPVIADVSSEDGAAAAAEAVRERGARWMSWCTTPGSSA